MEGTVDSIEKLRDDMEAVNKFRYLGDRINASGGCEAAVTANVEIGWVRFRESCHWEIDFCLNIK